MVHIFAAPSTTQEAQKSSKDQPPRGGSKEEVKVEDMTETWRLETNKNDERQAGEMDKKNEITPR